MTVEFRPATEADYSAICALVPTEDEMFLACPRGHFPWTVGQLRTLAEVRHDLTVAVDDGQVVGFANLYDLVQGQHAFIGNVIIAGHRRREGLGRRLMQYMLDRACVDYGLSEVRISVFCHNPPALWLYAGLGFEPYALDMRRHPRGEELPLLHMRRRCDRAAPVEHPLA